MTQVQLRSRLQHMSRRRRRPSYAFGIAMAIIVLSGIILAVVMWLSSGPHHSSNDPNRTPNHSVQYQHLDIRG